MLRRRWEGTVAGTTGTQHRRHRELGEARGGGGRYRRSHGTLEIGRRSFCWPERPEGRRPAPEKMNCPARRSRGRRARDLLLDGGKAAEEGEGAEEVKKYLSSCLVRPPDLSSVGAGRRRSSGCSGDLQRFAVAGTSSG